MSKYQKTLINAINPDVFWANVETLEKLFTF